MNKNPTYIFSITPCITGRGPSCTSRLCSKDVNGGSRFESLIKPVDVCRNPPVFRCQKKATVAGKKKE